MAADAARDEAMAFETCLAQGSLHLKGSHKMSPLLSLPVSGRDADFSGAISAAEVSPEQISPRPAASPEETSGASPSEPGPSGKTLIAGFYLSDWQLPPGLGNRNLDEVVAEVERSCARVGPITRQQALRLVIGMGYNAEAAVDKWRDVVSWRREHHMDAVRARLLGAMCSQHPVRFSHEVDVYSRLFRGCPCALLTADGRPVSVWHAGAADMGRVGDLPPDHCRRWSQEVFEYADLWIARETERTRCLSGYLQVYNMQGLSLRQVTSPEVKDRLKAALSAGGFYVEAVAHVYVVNASRLFSMAWKLIRGFLSPWTASKITVSSTIPDELIADLGGPASQSSESLYKLLAAAADSTSPEPCLARVQRPHAENSLRALEESASTAASGTGCDGFEATAEALLHSSEEALEPIPDIPGALHVAGFFLRPDQLPPGSEERDLEALVEEVHKACSRVAPVSRQQALRLTLGMGYNPHAALAKWKEVVEWRKANSMDHVRQDQADKMRDTGDVSFPHQEEVFAKLVCVSPCALYAANGTPVSIWHAGTLNVSAAASLPSENVARWSRAVFEYKDLWISRRSEQHKRLLGYIQVYDMQGLTWRHYSSREIADKLKTALQSGSFYVEAVSHMYVINASRLFSMVWKVVRNLISPWTASKISVSSGVPDDLIHSLGGPTSSAARRFQQLIARSPEEAAKMTAVMRPPGQVSEPISPTSPLANCSVATELGSLQSECTGAPKPALDIETDMSSANLEEPVSPGTRCVAGYFLERSQLPPGWEGHDLNALVAEIHGTCSHISPLTMQQALRLMLGMGYDRVAAVSKWREITTWRETHGLENIRAQQVVVLESTKPICFPSEEEVYTKFLKVCPCALLASNGAPVSVWHAKTLNSSAVAELSAADISSWSHAVFEYKDVWISRESEERRRLIGYIQVYDMNGVGLRHLTSRDIGEKLKGCLQPGAFYMEAVSHMYIVNASALFSMAWKVIRNLISPWTASKITVSNSIPEELLRDLGGPDSVASGVLKEILAAEGDDLGRFPVMRPCTAI
ncbi:SFH9 [Symbiodinium microadriaticum]|nr:SFH9 [Symbiodinium microadriaticum]